MRSKFSLLSQAEVSRELQAAAQEKASRYRESISDVRAEVRRLTELLATQEDVNPIKLRLKALGSDYWGVALLECYRRAPRGADRHRFVFAAIPEARVSEAARQLGLEALRDRSSSVRMRAHQVLAYSLDRQVLPALLGSLAKESRSELQESINAAIKAINKQNHHLYIDREEDGLSHWCVLPWDDHDPAVQRGKLNYLIDKVREGWAIDI